MAIDHPIRTSPLPSCPTCGKRMVLRRPKAGGKQFRPFFGCSTWPECDGTRNILPNGLPQVDDDEDIHWYSTAYDKENDVHENATTYSRSTDRTRGTFADEIKRCPHGVPTTKACAICDPDGFNRSNW